MTIINGYFGLKLTRAGQISGRPFVSILLEIPRFNIKAPVSFLVDTGADTTTLHPGDIENLGIPMGNLYSAQLEATGVGGTTKYAKEDVILHMGNVQVRRAIGIGPTVKNHYAIVRNKGAPSLLGMDVLGVVNLLVDFVNQTVTLRLHDSNVVGMSQIKLKSQLRGPRRRQNKRKR